MLLGVCYFYIWTFNIKHKQYSNEFCPPMNPSTPRSPLQLTAHLVVTPFCLCLTPIWPHHSNKFHQHWVSVSRQIVLLSLEWQGIRRPVMSHEYFYQESTFSIGREQSQVRFEYPTPREQWFHRERDKSLDQSLSTERGSFLIIFHGKVAHQIKQKLLPKRT